MKGKAREKVLDLYLFFLGPSLTQSFCFQSYQFLTRSFSLKDRHKQASVTHRVPHSRPSRPIFSWKCSNNLVSFPLDCWVVSIFGLLCSLMKLSLRTSACRGVTQKHLLSDSFYSCILLRSR